MNDKVVKLKVVKPRKSKAHPFDLQILHGMIDKIESGEIKEIAMVGLSKDGTIIESWSAPRKKGNGFRMVGAIETLRSHYLNANIED